MISLIFNVDVAHKHDTINVVKSKTKKIIVFRLATMTTNYARLSPPWTFEKFANGNIAAPKQVEFDQRANALAFRIGSRVARVDVG